MNHSNSHLDQASSADSHGHQSGRNDCAEVTAAVATVEIARTSPEMPAFNRDLPLEDRSDEVLRVSELLFHAVTNWVDFYRMVFGVGGLVTTMYPTAEEQICFSQSPAYTQVQEQLNGLRERDTSKVEEVEAQRMITIRVPKSVHERLCDEANQLEVSVNKLCISKLIQFVDRQTVPKERGKRRGRRPGPQKSTRKKSKQASAIVGEESVSVSDESVSGNMSGEN